MLALSWIGDAGELMDVADGSQPDLEGGHGDAAGVGVQPGGHHCHVGGQGLALMGGTEADKIMLVGQRL